MRLTEEQTIRIAKKALEDLGFGTDDLVNPRVRFMENTEDDLMDQNSGAWLVGFEFGFGDIKFDPPLQAFIAIRDADGIAKDISIKRKFILLGYDVSADKYYEKPRPAPK